jgi:drug/metabolite transporter (DMT)-like permease
MGRVDIRGPVQAGTAMILVGSSVAASSLVAGYPILAGQAARYALGGAVLAALARKRLPRPHPVQIPRLLALAATGLAGFNILLIGALREAEAASVGVIVGCVPLALALLGPVIEGRAPSGRVVVGALLVSAGAVVVQWSGGRMPPPGLALSLGALACEAAFSLLAVPLLATLGPVGVSTYACVAAAAMLVAGAVLVDGSAAARLPTPQETAAFGYLAVVVTALAFVLWYSGVRRLGVARAGLFAGLVPVAALVTSAAVGAAALTLPRLAGTVAVGAGVTLGMNRRREQLTSQPPSGNSRVSVAGQAQRPAPTATRAGRPARR